ncbi:MAG TPA: major capsid protein [Microlunatus sp.]
MPNPTVADLHVNVPLTNVSVAYMQSADSYIADKVFPRLPVDKQSNIFYKYSKSDWRRTDVEKRAPSTESAGTGWNTTTDTYFAHVYAVHKDIDDQTRANADSVWNLDRDSTEFITNQHLLKRDIDWTNSYFKTGVWATEKTGVTSAPSASQFVQWDQASSDPIGDVAQWLIDFRQLTGFAPNVAVLGPYVMKALKQHPDILDRIKYTQKGIVTEDLIATLFDVDELYVTYATQATGPQIPDAALQDAAASYSFIGNPKGVLFAYAPSSPSLLTPSAGYTFTWKGYMGGNSMGVKVSKFRMQHIKSDRVEAEQSYDMKPVCTDMGLFLASAVA